jgi:hypothetical protein
MHDASRKIPHDLSTDADDRPANGPPVSSISIELCIDRPVAPPRYGAMPTSYVGETCGWKHVIQELVGLSQVGHRTSPEQSPSCRTTAPSPSPPLHLSILSHPRLPTDAANAFDATSTVSKRRKPDNFRRTAEEHSACLYTKKKTC